MTITFRCVRALASASFLLVVLTSASGAQGTGLVASSDLAYADIERLSELGVLDSTVIGQRPYSRREIARIAGVARARLNGRDARFERVSSFAEGLVRRLERFNGAADGGSSDGDIALIDGLTLSFVSTDANRRGFPAPHSKPVEATIDPLAQRRLGMPAVRGETGSLEISHRIEPTSWLALQARERFEYRRPNDTTLKKDTGELLLASLRARIGNLAITVGRQQLTWSQSEGDGLFLASDAPALDQVVLSADHPFVLPWFLRKLGPTQATLAIAELGPSAIRSHSKLLTYKLSIQPSNAVELGGTFMNHYGGVGGRKSNFSDRLIDFLPFVDVFRTHNYVDTTRTFDVDSDKLLGVDGRVRLDALGGTMLTGELLIDDFDPHRIPKLLTGYGSQTFAIILPHLGTPALSAKLSAKHLGILTYTHGELRDGIASRGRLLGDELGPDAKSYSALVRLASSTGMRLEVEGRSNIYSNASYNSFYPDPGKSKFVVQKIATRPDELRDLVFATLILQPSEGVALTMRGGAERIRNADFLGGRRRDIIGEIAMRFGL
ncbi:MAG: capsule assembly Wzi family protein [bacterium]